MNARTCGPTARLPRPDLLDRAIVICPPVIEQRMTEGEHDALMERHAAAIMGGLVDLFAKSLAELPQVDIPRNKMPRMADFCMLGKAMNFVLEGEKGDFLNLYLGYLVAIVLFLPINLR